MRIRSRSFALLSVGIAAALIIPLGASLLIADHEAGIRQRRYVAGFAEDALRETERTGDQIELGASIFGAVPESAACSDRGLAVLRQIDLESTLLQAAGHITPRNVMDCSSVGGRSSVGLGPPQLVTIHGVRIWTDVELLPGGGRYVAVAKGSFVGVVHKDLALEFVTKVPGLAIASLNRSTRKVILKRGQINDEWLNFVRNSTAHTRQDDYVVVARESRRQDVGAVAAMPRAQLAWIDDELKRLLVPAGALVGLLSAALLIFMARCRMSMPSMIRSALRAQEFHLSYQPIIELKTGRTIGAEALIRWKTESGENIPPDHFIGVAEQAGVIRLITNRVLELLQDDAREVLRITPAFRFSINFSAADIHADDLSETLARFRKASGLPARQIVVEATERSFMDASRASASLRSIRADGVQVAIDDFGTGYSNLRYLAQLNVDILKIDKLFIDEVGTDSTCGQVAERIIAMAQALELKIVAEGVENAEQAARLVQLGVDFAQGYHFARPLCLDDLLQRLRAERKPQLIRGAVEAA